MREENHDQLVSFIWNIANDGDQKVTVKVDVRDVKIEENFKFFQLWQSQCFQSEILYL